MIRLKLMVIVVVILGFVVNNNSVCVDEEKIIWVDKTRIVLFFVGLLF